jgi:hypothetical protein
LVSKLEEVNLIGFAFGLRGEGGEAIRKGVIDRGHLQLRRFSVRRTILRAANSFRFSGDFLLCTTALKGPDVPAPEAAPLQELVDGI